MNGRNGDRRAALMIDESFDLEQFAIRTEDSGAWTLWYRAGEARAEADQATRQNLALLALVPVVAACIETRAAAIASIPVMVDGAEAGTHPVFQRGHTRRIADTFNLWWEIEGALCTYGNAYLRRVGDPLFELQWYHPLVVTEMLDGLGNLDHYQTEGPNQQIVSLDEMVHLREWSSEGFITGRGPLEKSFLAAKIERFLAQAVNGFWKRGGRPLGFWVADQTVGEDEMRKTETWLQRLFGSASRAFRMGLLSGGWKWQPISFSPEELALPEMRHEDRLDVCNAFRVPPEILGVVEANYATKREARMQLYEETIIPAVQARNRALTLALGMNFESDVENIPALQRLRQMHEQSGWRRD